MVKQAERAESGSTMTLDDASRLATTDVRFPSTPQIAAEKMYGWSILIDLFHGRAQAIAVAIRAFVIAVGPALHRIHDQHLDNPAMGMDLVCRVLFDAQQEYFTWANAVALAGNAVGVAIPNFASLKNDVATYRTSRLSPLPGSWYAMMDSPPSDRRQTPEERITSPRAQAGASPAFNADADPRLLRRFDTSSFSSVTAMMEGHEVAVPKVGGKDICLVWALKGKCSRTCKRKAQHKTYSRAVVQDIHALLDTCGLAAGN